MADLRGRRRRAHAPAARAGGRRAPASRRRRVRVARARQPGAARGDAELGRRQRDRVVRRRGRGRGPAAAARDRRRRSSTGLEACGLRAGRARRDRVERRCSSARSRPGSARSRSWIADPTQEKALILVSVLVDSRPVWGVHTGTPVADTFRLAPSNPALLRLLARFALSHRPPTGFFRGLVVEHSRRAPRPARPQARRRDPDRRPRPLGRDRRRRDERVDDRAAARRRRRPGPCPTADAHTLEDAFDADHRAAARAPGRAAPRRRGAR